MAKAFKILNQAERAEIRDFVSLMKKWKTSNPSVYARVKSHLLKTQPSALVNLGIETTREAGMASDLLPLYVPKGIREYRNQGVLSKAARTKAINMNDNVLLKLVREGTKSTAYSEGVSFSRGKLLVSAPDLVRKAKEATIGGVPVGPGAQKGKEMASLGKGFGGLNFNPGSPFIGETSTRPLEGGVLGGIKGERIFSTSAEARAHAARQNSALLSGKGVPETRQMWAASKRKAGYVVRMRTMDPDTLSLVARAPQNSTVNLGAFGKIAATSKVKAGAAKGLTDQLVSSGFPLPEQRGVGARRQATRTLRGMQSHLALDPFAADTDDVRAFRRIQSPSTFRDRSRLRSLRAADAASPTLAEAAEQSALLKGQIKGAKAVKRFNKNLKWAKKVGLGTKSARAFGAATGVGGAALRFMNHPLVWGGLLGYEALDKLVLDPRRQRAALAEEGIGLIQQGAVGALEAREEDTNKFLRSMVRERNAAARDQMREARRFQDAMSLIDNNKELLGSIAVTRPPSTAELLESLGDHR